MSAAVRSTSWRASSSALLNAARTGKGTVVDAAIVDGSAHMMALLMSMAPAGNLVTERGQSLLDGPHWCRSYACADGEWLTVQCLEPKFYAEFLRLWGLWDDPGLAAQYDRTQWPVQTEKRALSEAQPVAHWAALFAGSDACVARFCRPRRRQGRPTWPRAGHGPAPRAYCNPRRPPASATPAPAGRAARTWRRLRRHPAGVDRTRKTRLNRGLSPETGRAARRCGYRADAWASRPC